MNVAEQPSIGNWIEDTINYQNEDVFILYAIVLIVSVVICIVTYKQACSKQLEIDSKLKNKQEREII